MPREGLDFVVGQDVRLSEVLREPEVTALLRHAVEAGAAGAALTDAGRSFRWSRGEESSPSALLRHAVLLEGEPVGEVTVAPGRDAGAAQGIARMLAGALQAMIDANLKRMLTAEVHTCVVNLSYEDLLAANRQLTESEARYRELAQSLEIKVRQRTEELKRAYAHLIEQEKMASVGQLAAGVAHEINNPLGYILSNLNSLRRYAERLVAVLDFFLQAPLPPAVAEEAEALCKRLRIDFVREDLGDLLSQSIAGAERMRKIVSDLKGFSHIDDIGRTPFDLHLEIDRTLEVMRREIPEGTRLVREYAALPPLCGDPGKLCQALLNLFRNAFQSRRDGLVVAIRTEKTDGGVRVTVRDNGPGVPEEIRTRIFEPFFTTREVGQGMGLGLSVAYNSVKACGGSLRHVENGGSEGAAFVIEIPDGEDAHGPIR